MKISSRRQISFLGDDGNEESTIGSTTIPGILEEIRQLKDDVKAQGKTIANQGTTIANQGTTISTQGETIVNQGTTIANQEETIKQQAATIETLAKQIASPSSSSNPLLEAISSPLTVRVSSASASGEYSSDVAMNAFDGDVGTEWSSDNDPKAWVQGDFTGTYCLSYFTYKQRDTGFHNKQIKLSFSSPNVTAQVFDLKDDSEITTFDFKPPVCVTSVRVEATEAYRYSNNGASHIAFHGLEPLAHSPRMCPPGTASPSGLYPGKRL